MLERSKERSFVDKKLLISLSYQFNHGVYYLPTILDAGKNEDLVRMGAIGRRNNGREGEVRSEEEPHTC